VILDCSHTPVSQPSGLTGHFPADGESLRAVPVRSLSSHSALPLHLSSLPVNHSSLTAHYSAADSDSHAVHHSSHSDCSGLAHYGYQYATVTVTATAQRIHHPSLLPISQPLLPPHPPLLPLSHTGHHSSAHTPAAHHFTPDSRITPPSHLEMSNTTPPTNISTSSNGIPSPLPVGPITNDELTASFNYITQRNHGRSHSPPRLHQPHTAAVATTPAAAALLAVATPSRYSPLSIPEAPSSSTTDMEDDAITTAAPATSQRFIEQEDARMRTARKRMMTDPLAVTPGGPDSPTAAPAPATFNGNTTGLHHAQPDGLSTTVTAPTPSSSSSSPYSSFPSASSSSHSLPQGKKAKTSATAKQSRTINSFFRSDSSTTLPTSAVPTPLTTDTASTPAHPQTPHAGPGHPSLSSVPSDSSQHLIPPSLPITVTSSSPVTVAESAPAAPPAQPGKKGKSKSRNRRSNEESTNTTTAATSVSASAASPSAAAAAHRHKAALEQEREAAHSSIAAAHADIAMLREYIARNNLPLPTTAAPVAASASQPVSLTQPSRPSPSPVSGSTTEMKQQLSSSPPKPATNASPPPTNSKAEKPERHLPLPLREMHLPKDTKIAALGLARVSNTDFVLAVRLQAGQNRAGLHKLLSHPTFPPRNSHPTQHRQAIAQLLADKSALNLPVPAIPAIVLSLTSPSRLEQEIARCQANSPVLPYLLGLRAYTDSSPPLHLHPTLSSIPRSLLVPSWATLLGPATRSMGVNEDTNHQSIVLNTPNVYTREIIFRYIGHHIDLATTWANSPTTHFTSESPSDRQWVQQTRATGAINVDLSLSDYNIRYHFTQLCGFPTGPQFPVPPGQYANQEELYGNNRLLYEFLTLAAPHCTPDIHVNPAGYTSQTITFYHEPQYRHELYNLVGATSPAHGIVRPIKVRFQQCKKATSVCCTFCWRGGHTSHRCPYNLSSSNPVMFMDDNGTGAVPMQYGQRACRHCYAFDHLESSCSLPAPDHICKLCDEAGHSSYACTRYSATWVPLTPAPPRSGTPGPTSLATSSSGQGTPARINQGTRRPSPILTQQTTWANLYHQPRDPVAVHNHLPPPFLHPSAFPSLPLPQPPVSNCYTRPTNTTPPLPASPAASTASPLPSPPPTPERTTVSPPPLRYNTDPAISAQLAGLQSIVEKLVGMVAETRTVSAETQSLQALVMEQSAQIRQLTVVLQHQSLLLSQVNMVHTQSGAAPSHQPSAATPPTTSIFITASPNQSPAPTMTNNTGTLTSHLGVPTRGDPVPGSAPQPVHPASQSASPTDNNAASPSTAYPPSSLTQYLPGGNSHTRQPTSPQ
jgi:hypothetical protein